MRDDVIEALSGGWVTVTISEDGSTPYADKPIKTLTEHRFNHSPNASYEKWHKNQDDAREDAKNVVAESERLHRDQEPPNFR